MAASKRLPYRSYYYCCVSLPFGSVGWCYITKKICVVSSIVTEVNTIFFIIFSKRCLSMAIEKPQRLDTLCY